MATKPITDPLVLHACELLSCLGPVQAKRMFGGYGLSVDGMNVAIIAYDTLFLKTNEQTLPQWLSVGAHAFEYGANGERRQAHYHTPPDEALESPALMAPWARLALEAAVAARQPRPRRRTPSSPQ